MFDHNHPKNLRSINPIRSALLSDEPVIYSFLCLLENTVLDRAAFQSIYEKNLRNSDIYYLVAEHISHEVVGFISCHTQLLLHHGGKIGEIQELFVRPDMRNQGIGQRLVTELKAIAFREGLVNLEVTTNMKRIDTIRFYEREQFNHTHVKLVYPVPPVESPMS